MLNTAVGYRAENRTLFNVEGTRRSVSTFPKNVLSMLCSFMSPLRRGGGHIVFGVDPVGGVGGVGGVAFCLHDIS